MVTARTKNKMRRKLSFTLTSNWFQENPGKPRY
jgi:hypothetical protein